jgi:hypothetical protein
LSSRQATRNRHPYQDDGPQHRALCPDTSADLRRHKGKDAHAKDGYRRQQSQEGATEPEVLTYRLQYRRHRRDSRTEVKGYEEQAYQ